MTDQPYLNKEKDSIIYILVRQVKDSLELAEIGKSEMVEHLSLDLGKEIRTCMNIDLLLGIILEGLINQLGDEKIDDWTWQELEKSSTPLKWRIVSGVVKGFSLGEEPMNTIIKLQKKRNRLAHPKSEKRDNSTIIESVEGKIAINPKDSLKLPVEESIVWFGYQKYYEEYNFKESKKNFLFALNAISEIYKLFKLTEELEWVNDMVNEVKKIKVPIRGKLT